MKHLFIFITALVAMSEAKLTSVAVFKTPGGAWAAEEVSTDLPNARSGVVATATYSDSLLRIGWDTLSVNSNASAPDFDQAYAAGYAEGVLTAERICQQWFNNAGSFLNGTINPQPYPPQVVDFFEANMQWVDANVRQKANPSDKDGKDHNPVWHLAGVVWFQWNGIYDGFASRQVCNLSKTDMYGLTSTGDLLDIVPAVTGSVPNWRDMTPKEFRNYMRQRSHCTALVKVTDNLSDLFFSHSTWYLYTYTTRIYKTYTLLYNHPSVVAKTVSFSSYPAAVMSMDDFHIVDSGIVAMETSLIVFNTSLYTDNVTPQSLLYWMRVMMANRGAGNASQWAYLFSQHNSGTYNNEWLVLDLKNFQPGKPLVPDTLWVVDQMPGYIHGADQTRLLSYGYVPSYNVPFYVDVFNALGYPAAIVTGGPDSLDYETCARANIFRRDQGTVRDVPTLQHLMLYNDYLHDPLSKGHPDYAPASRADLSGEWCGGAYDNKLSSFSMWQDNMSVLARSGPTNQQPPFLFTNTTAKCSVTNGLPVTFNFTYMNFHVVEGDLRVGGLKEIK